MILVVGSTGVVGGDISRRLLVAAATDPMQRSFAALMRCYADGDPIEMGRTSELVGDQLTSVEAFAKACLPVGTAG